MYVSRLFAVKTRWRSWSRLGGIQLCMLWERNTGRLNTSGLKLITYRSALAFAPFSGLQNFGLERFQCNEHYILSSRRCRCHFVSYCIALLATFCNVSFVCLHCRSRILHLLWEPVVVGVFLDFVFYFPVLQQLFFVVCTWGGEVNFISAPPRFFFCIFGLVEKCEAGT